MNIHSENKAQVGTFVISKAGRDKTKGFIVLKVIDDDYVLIADGELRKSDKPKLKKIKHLNLTRMQSETIKEKIEAGDKVSDVQLKKAIADFSYGKRT